jgi:hypothetical protein
MNNITDIKNIKAGTKVNICNELKKLILIITLKKYSSSKFPNNEKIKNIIELKPKHIDRDTMYLK